MVERFDAECAIPYLPPVNGGIEVDVSKGVVEIVNN
jgi:hypothetical protein